MLVVREALGEPRRPTRKKKEFRDASRHIESELDRRDPAADWIWSNPVPCLQLDGDLLNRCFLMIAATSFLASRRKQRAGSKPPQKIAANALKCYRGTRRVRCPIEEVRESIEIDLAQCGMSDRI